MRNSPDEPLHPQDDRRQQFTEEELDAIIASAQGAERSKTSDGTPLSEQDKFNAIRSALREQDAADQQEETRISIADKIQRMKAGNYEPPEGEEPEVSPGFPEAPEDEDAPEVAAMIAASPPPKKKRRPAKKKKKTKKKKSGGLAALFPAKGDSAFEVIRKSVFLMSSAIFMVCMFLIGDYFWTNYQNKLMNEAKASIYDPGSVKVEKKTKTDDYGTPYEAYVLLDNARRMLEINPEVVGWITIKDTPVNYAVLQHRNAEDGNSFYLDKNIDLKPEKAGSIFMDYRNYFDFVVGDKRLYDNSQNIIIYGHNMHDYNMFGSLKKYINEADYYDAHPIIELNSNYRAYKYKIFGMIIVDIDDTTETAFDYWNTLNFATEEDFYNYVNEIKRRTVRLTAVDVTYGDQILTLSTCNSTFTDGRLVVFGRLLRDGESTEVGPSTPNPNIKWPNSYYKWRKNTYDPNAEFVPYG